MGREYITEFVERRVPIPAENMDTDETNYVVMKNELILGKGSNAGKEMSGLTITANKLLRLLIMQCLKTDFEFKPYKITTTELSEFLSIDKSNLSRARIVQDLTLTLMKEVVLVGDGNPNHNWKAYHWVETAEYKDGVYTFQLSRDMKQFLLNLGRNYTQYEIGEILSFKSVYALRLFELITMTLGLQRKKDKIYNENTATIELSDETVRLATGTTSRYLKTNDFKKNVMDIAAREINARTFGWKMSYEYIKEGRRVIGYRITLRDSLYGMHVKAGKWKDQEMIEDDRITGQMNIFDYELKENI